MRLAPVNLEAQGKAHGVDVADVCQTLRMIDRMSDDEVASRIGAGSDP